MQTYIVRCFWLYFKEKPVIIPETRVEKDFMSSVPNFVRNVMGSSAGAGSGEFHVYRHLRRKEYARQKCIQIKSLREQLDEEYHKKLEQNRLEAEAKTNKRRAKRLRKKQKMKEKNGKRAKLQDGRQTEGANTDEETVKSDTDEKEQSDDSKGGIDDDKKPFGEFDRENNIET